MATDALLNAAPAVRRSRSLMRIYLLEAKYECMKLIRIPAQMVPTLAFPLVFYMFFGVAFGHGQSLGGVPMASYFLATYGTFGVMGASLLGFGIGVATERGQGWLQVKRATPMPISAYFGAKIAMSVLFSAVIILGLFILGSLFGHVRFAPAIWIELFFLLLSGSLPFCALGLMVGYFAGPNSAPAVVNFVYLPMSLLSGLWMPIEIMPKVIQKIASFLPAYHLAQLNLGVLGTGHGNRGGHVLALASYTVLFVTLASIGYGRDEGKTYG